MTGYEACMTGSSRSSKLKKLVQQDVCLLYPKPIP